MARMNYCKKCRCEVPPGESCPYCGAHLTRAGERLSLNYVRVPLRDWFSWNAVLRVALPALLLIALLLVLLEGNVETLAAEGLFWVLIATLGVVLGISALVLLLQGVENLHYVLDKDGVHAYTYLPQPTRLELLSRSLGADTVEQLNEKGENSVAGYTLVQVKHLLWADVKRARFWPEAGKLLLFRPAWWQSMAVHCPPEDYSALEETVRKKLGRKVPVLPAPPKKKKK